jgi:hypothetical protein
VPGGFLLRGAVPWMTGWDQVDVIYVWALAAPLVAAPGAHHDLLAALIDSRASATLRASLRSLVAANASRTVALVFDGHFVPDERIVSRAPYTPPPAHDAGGRLNGSLALGVSGRCLTLMGPSELDRELEARRAELDAAGDDTLARARAAAVELAHRASGRLIAALGSESLGTDHHAQRLAREAAFLIAFGSRPAIRHALLRLLASPRRGGTP